HALLELKKLARDTGFEAAAGPRADPAPGAAGPRAGARAAARTAADLSGRTGRHALRAEKPAGEELPRAENSPSG
ncbi:hypothetical protein ABZ439_35380, partial [Streptomyces sp. NPDC005840]